MRASSKQLPDHAENIEEEGEEHAVENSEILAEKRLKHRVAEESAVCEYHCEAVYFFLGAVLFKLEGEKPYCRGKNVHKHGKSENYKGIFNKRGIVVLLQCTYDEKRIRDINKH